MRSDAAAEGEPQSRFERELADPLTGVAADLEADSTAMVIAFGGLIGRLGIYPFEFFRTVAPLGVKKMFVRDRLGCWYQLGVHGVGEDVDAVGAALGALIAESGVERAIAVGNSAGGYAALLFGHLLGIDEVHAFVPQTFIDPERRRASGDERWPRETTRLAESGRLDPRYADLRAVLTDAGRSHTTTSHIYHSHDPRDVAHARNLADVEGVVFHVMDEGGHQLVRTLRDSGALQGLLARAVRGAP